MPEITVAGAGAGTISIQVTSSAAQRAGQSALAAVANASTELQLALATNVTIPAGSTSNVILATAPAPVGITTAGSNAVTIISGQGGLILTQQAIAAGSLIVAGGGRNQITLAGASTVSLDTSPTSVEGGIQTGASTVNALAGGAVVDVNATPNDATHSDTALILAAGADSIALAGDATGIAAAAVGINDPSVQVSLANRSVAFLAGATVDVTTGAGDETVGVLSGSTEMMTGAASGGGAIAVASGGLLTGDLLINPRSQDVTVFGGAGATSLFGTGDGTAVNEGQDFISDGIGYFRLGTAGGSIAVSAPDLGTAEATTIIGGGAGDALYAQSGNVSLRGAAGTVLLWAAGAVTLGGAAVAAAPEGVVLDAGAATDATIAGAPGGANTIIGGSGAATVWGNHGPSDAGNLYLDGAPGGNLTIMDFTVADTVRLSASQQVGGVTGNTVILTDGTRMTITDGLVNWGNVKQYFHQ